MLFTRSDRLRSCGYLPLCIVTSLLWSGCASHIGTAYTAPQITLPASFSQVSGAQAAGAQSRSAVPTARWWTAFHDPALTALIDEALAKNPNLAIAALKVKQARLQADLAVSQTTPSLTSSAATSHNRALDSGSTANASSFRIATSYELDLFGKLSSAKDAATWEAQATTADLANSQWTLIRTVAGLYWQLGYLNQRLDDVHANLHNSVQQLHIINVQHQAGHVSGLEVAQAQQAVITQQTTLSQLLQQRTESRNALGLLLDQPATATASFYEPTHLPSQPLPAIVAGIPADVLAMRPDVHAAELRLRKVLANGNALKASYYPDFSLTGALGTSSTALLSFLKNPALTLGAGLSLPFLQYHDMQRNLQISALEYEQAVIGFRQTLLQALSDTDNALAAAQQLAEQVKIQQAQYATAQKIENLTRIRYNAGAIALTSLLDAMDNTRQAASVLAQTRTNLLSNRLLLCQYLSY